MKKLLPLLYFTCVIICLPLASAAQCNANFLVSNNRCTNGAVSFTDFSMTTGPADSVIKEIWVWGDGKSDTTNFAHSTTHNYFSNGSFLVTQKIFTVNNCSSTVSQNISITIKPQVSYAISPIISYCAFDSVLFYNQSTISTGEPLSILWRFYDDGSTSVDNIQNHRYYDQGLYWTSLTVTAQNGCVDSLRKQIATIAPTKASFTIPHLQCAGDSVSITETSYMASPSSFYNKTWYFGDGTSQTDNDVTNKTIKHRYNIPGRYTVTLRYETSNCLHYYSDSLVVAVKPVASFTTTPGAAGLCGIQGIAFNNSSFSSLPGPLSYQWKFNGFFTDTTINPYFNYTSNGWYPVSLKVIPATGCSATLDTTIIISGIQPKPRANFRYATDTTNLLRFNFYDTSFADAPTSIVNYAWNFGDGNSSATAANTIANTYNERGTYTVQEIVTASNGCADTITKFVVVDSTPVVLCNPSFSVTVTACLGGTTLITDHSSTSNGMDSVIKEIWQYGDGNVDTVTGNFGNRTHVYAVAGLYTVSLTIFTRSGCTSTRTANTAVRSTFVDGDFSYIQIPDCNSTSQQIQFSVTAQNYYGPLVTKWYFGDGDSDGTILDPIHTYAFPGTYQVKLLSRVSICSFEFDTTIKTVQVLPKSKAGMLYRVDEANSKTIHFADRSVSGFNNITGWVWDFGDGATSTEQNPAHTFSAYGTYNVKHSFLSELAACAMDTVADIIHIDSFVTASPNALQSSMGKDFWTGFGYIESMRLRTSLGSSTTAMSLYLAAGENPATVVIDIPAMPFAKRSLAGFPKIIYIPADSVVEVTGFPTGDPDDAFNASGFADSRLYFTGVTDRAIHITSNQPVGAWQHIYSSNNSAGGTLLVPTNVWGNSYFVQTKGGGSNINNPQSYFFVIAERDSTVIQFTPATYIVDSSTATIFKDNHLPENILYSPGNTYTKLLNKGEVFNAMGFIAGTGRGNSASGAISLDLSGTKIVSADPLKKIAVFAGNGRLLISSAGCLNSTGSDNLIQQMFPKTVWGTKYFSTPTKTMEYGIYRITVDDTATDVRVNGTTLLRSGLLNGRYYEVENNRPNVIESDQRVMVTQYITSPDCPGAQFGNNGIGDPEMINLTPLKYATNNVTVYSPAFKNATTGASYINVVLKAAAISSFRLDNSSLVDTGTSSFLTTGVYGSSSLVPAANAFKAHPGDPGYYYGRFKVTTGAVHTLRSDSLFTAIAYGVSNGESIGYNVGFKFNTGQDRYIFIGNGNWTEAINWLGNKVPPDPLPMGAEVIISGHCLLNIVQVIEDGARLTVETGGSLRISGKLSIHQ